MADTLVETAQLLFVKYRAFGSMHRPIHVAADRWETACGIDLSDKEDRMLRGRRDLSDVTCRKCLSKRREGEMRDPEVLP